MRIVLIGGGTGGHFYPLIAVAEAIEDICLERTLIEPELYYVGPPAFDSEALLEHDITFIPPSAGKVRRYVSALNILSFFTNAAGIIRSTRQLFSLYPDVVFSTGGYAAFPTLVAARMLQIPVVIYDADATPGRVSLWSSKFAKWIGVAHAASATKYPDRVRDKIAAVGHPIRKAIIEPVKEGGYEFLKLDSSVPTVFVMGGSQGARAINEVVLDALGVMVSQFNIVHQAGLANTGDVSGIASVVLKDSQYANRYKMFGLLNTLALRMAAGIASVVVARAGSGTIFEIASWGLPSILVPIPLDVSHDQKENAFSYARSGAAVVIEQHHLSPHLLVAEIQRIVGDTALRAKRTAAPHTFARPDAAQKIALTLLETSIEHEPV